MLACFHMCDAKANFRSDGNMNMTVAFIAQMREIFGLRLCMDDCGKKNDVNIIIPCTFLSCF